MGGGQTGNEAKDGFPVAELCPIHAHYLFIQDRPTRLSLNFSLLPSQSGGERERVKRTLSSAFVVDVDHTVYHTGKRKKFQAKLRSRKAQRVTRHNLSPDPESVVGYNFVWPVTQYRGLEFWT